MPQLTYRDYLYEPMFPHMWCTGCGNGIVLQAIARALADLALPKNKVVIVTGIGCWGKADDYFSTSAFHGTHGRALAFATGIKAAKPDLKVIALMGDGDGATIGGNHLIHAARRNLDLTAVVVNNLNYGMTGGQYSATTPAGSKTSTCYLGNPEREMDLCKLVEAAGAVYVARSTVYHAAQLRSMIRAAIQKKGFSFVEAASACPTHWGRLNKMPTPVEMMKWFRDNAVPKQAYEKLSAHERAGKVPVGVFVDVDTPDFLERYEAIRALRLKELGLLPETAAEEKVGGVA